MGNASPPRLEGLTSEFVSLGISVMFSGPVTLTGKDTTARQSADPTM
jgi:hypothetical protein